MQILVLKMKNNIILILLLGILYSCNFKKTEDLSTIPFNQNPENILKDLTKHYEIRELSTTLPCIYTEDINKFRFGDMELNKVEFGYNKVFFLISDTISKKLEGIKIVLDGKQTNEKIWRYLNEQYGKPNMISPIPKPNIEGDVLGQSTYLWRSFSLDRFLFFHSVYTTRTVNNQKAPNIITNIYLINNDAQENDNNTKILERLTTALKDK